MEEVPMRLVPRKSSRPSTATGYSVIDDQLAIAGDLNTEGTVRVDGRVEGTLHRADTLIVGVNGTVIGDVEAREVIVGGTLVGTLTVGGRVEVQASATVQGDIRAEAVLLHEGGLVHGHVAIHPAGAANALEDEQRLEIGGAPRLPAAESA
jgi:cytoskeletal protein CcmA (bactofilin family)